MSAKCGKGSLKQKLDNALSSTSSAKRRCSSPNVNKSVNNDSGFASSASAKKKKVPIKTGKSNVSAKRRLDPNINKDDDKSIPVKSLKLDMDGVSSSSTLLRKSKRTSANPTKKKEDHSNGEKQDVKKGTTKMADKLANNLSVVKKVPQTSTPTSKSMKSIKKPTSSSKKSHGPAIRKTSKAKRKLKVEEPPMEVSEMNVSQILALGEGTDIKVDVPNDLTDSDSDESDWEEVSSNPVLAEPIIPENGVDITLDAPMISFKRKKKEHDLEGEIRRQLKRRQKEIQELVHKVHILCWVAHIKFINSTLNSEVLLADAHSLLSSNKLYPPKKTDLSYLERIVKVFRKYISLNEETKSEKSQESLELRLSGEFKAKVACSKNDLVFMFIVFLRALGVKVRVVMSLVTVPLKPTTEKNEADAKNTKAKPKSVKSKKNDELISTKPSTSKTSCSKIVVSDGETSKHFSEKEKPQAKLGGKRKVAEKVGKPLKTEQSKECQGGKVIKEEKDSDDDFSPKVVKPVAAKKKLDRRVLSSDEEVVSIKKTGQDVWTEVFLEEEEKWITVDIVKQKVHCIQFLYHRATHPVVYVLACNNDSTIKDVTKRYVPNWHSDTRKKRVSEAWWLETMEPYKPTESAIEREEDEDIARQLQDMPLPTSISEYKCHPLYALKRHLLKFEGIYPPDAPTLGFVRGEPVYGRECVVTLRSREIWFKEARVVRLNETPYKIVKSRPKYDKMTGDFKKDLPLELFGVWQTEDYIPPVAVDGKVPRNEYGNVDLFKPCMLPIGTVHLQIPALNRVARKMGIDCAPAVIGFEYHSGGCHPVHDGFVVCEEFKDKLLDAWNKEIDESAKRAEEKRDKRIYGNWRRLIRGLIIRENLKMKYAFGETSTEELPSTSSDSTQTQ